MKNIVIPVGKISAVGLFGIGLCTSVVVDEALKKVYTKNKIVDEVGKYGASVTASSPFIMAAVAAWNDKSMDIKIPIGKKKEKEFKEVDIETSVTSVDDMEEEQNKEFEEEHVHNVKKVAKRLPKATELLEKILEFAINYEESGAILKEKYVDEYNHHMKKIAKRVGFDPVYLTYHKDSNDMMAEIETSIEHMLANIKEASAFCGLELPKNLNNEFSEEEVFEVEESKKIVSDEVHIDDFIDQLAKYNIDPTDIDAVKFSEVYDKFYAGEISAVQACDMVLALFNNNEEIEEVNEPKEVEGVNTDIIYTENSDSTLDEIDNNIKNIDEVQNEIGKLLDELNEEHEVSNTNVDTDVEEHPINRKKK